MGANERQVGGNHYAQEFQHWDWVVHNRMGYLEGCATKYIARWKDKNGLQDLEKAGHYMQKAMEEFEAGNYRNGNLSVSTENYARSAAADNTYKFIEAGDYDECQKELLSMLSEWKTEHDLNFAMGLLEKYIARQEDVQEGQADAAAPLAPTTPSPASTDGPGRPCGAAHRATGQAPASSASTDGMENPFGYPGEE